MESEEHRRIKELVTAKIKEWIGCSIHEYPSAGHELDIFGVTPRGVSIHVEIIWSPSNFMKDINMIQQSDANVKVVIASPDVTSNSSYCREFDKAAVAQRRLGTIFHGNMIDGKRILEDNAYVENTLKSILLKLVEEARPLEKRFQRPKLKFPEPQDWDIRPDDITEEVLSNIFPVVKTPEFVYSAPIESRISVYPTSKLKEEIAVKCPFVLKMRKVFTFVNLQKPDSVFSKFVMEPASSERAEDWIIQEDKARWLVELLNNAAYEYCKSKIELQQHPKYRSIFFFKAQNDKEVSVDGKKVVQVIRMLDGTPDYFLHDAVTLKCIRLGQSTYLVIKPQFVFTKDGNRLLEKERAKSLAFKYTYREYNREFLERVKFWVSLLKTSSEVIRIPTGGESVELSTLPASISLNVGIARDQRYFGF